MFVRSPKQIIAFVNRCLLGETGKDEQLELGDYDVDETFYFWTMYGIGSAVITGTISKETARKEQERVGGLFRGMAVKIFLWRKLRREQRQRLETYGTAICAADRLLRDRNAEGFLYALVDAFGALAGESVHAELFRKAMTEENFKAACINTVIQNEEYFTEKFNGAIRYESYIPLLEKFFSACVEDGTAELFNSFGDEADELCLDAEKQEELRVPGENSKVMYGITRFN